MVYNLDWVNFPTFRTRHSLVFIAVLSFFSICSVCGCLYVCMHLGDFDNYFKNLNKSVFWHMDEILHVKLGISTKFYLWDIILSHTFNYIHVLNVPVLLSIGVCICKLSFILLHCGRQIYQQSWHWDHNISIVFITL